MSKKKTLDDIFNDDEFGILDSKSKNSNVKSENERLIESFQEINIFFEKHNREPESTNVSEFKLLSRLKALRNDEGKIEILKPYDSHNLLKTKEEVKSVADILDDDDLGILDTKETLSIFKLKNIPSSTQRSETDFVSQRKAMKDKEFLPYESMFKEVHRKLREREISLKRFRNPEKNLKKGNYYVLDGVLLYLEETSLEIGSVTLPSGDRLRKDGRTRIIFENGTVSNMLFRSLGKQLLNNGHLVTKTETETAKELFNNVNSVDEEDLDTGWIYVLRSKSTNKDIMSIKDLYKIGYSTVPIPERVKNASKEATYLMADVNIIAAYKTYNLDAQKFESLIHRFFAEVCLDIEILDKSGKIISPREWFIVPLTIIEEAIRLIFNEEIINYKYDSLNARIIKK